MNYLLSISYIRSLVIWIITIFSCSLSLHVSAMVYGYDPHGFSTHYFKKGNVVGLNYHLDDSGNRVWSEYRSEGSGGLGNANYLGDIAPATGKYKNATVIPGSRIRAIQFQIQSFQEEYPKQTKLMTSSQYALAEFTNRAGKAISKPPLLPTTRSVLVRYRGLSVAARGQDILLGQFSFDVTSLASLSGQTESVLVSSDGDILYSSNHNIGYKVGFIDFSGPKDKVIGGLPGIKLEVPPYGDVGVSSEDGSYYVQYFMPPCPGFSYSMTTNIYATFYYTSFNPRGNPVKSYTAMREDFDSCYGMAALFMDASDFQRAMTYLALVSTVSTIATPVYDLDFWVELMVLNGKMFVTDGLGNIISGAGETSYQTVPSDVKNTAQSNFDFDGDNKPDYAVLGNIDDEGVFRSDENGSLQLIFLSSENKDPQNLTKASFTRLADSTQNLQHQGLLKSLSNADMMDTDIFVFRESNGMLIMQQNGADGIAGGDFGIDGDNIFYQIIFRGPADGILGENFLSSIRFSEWASLTNLSPDLQSRYADHLRQGEEIRVVAINRKTGYIGSAITTLDNITQPDSVTGEPTADLSVYIDPIVMGPPNLKIWAERVKKDQHGLTAGQVDQYTVGNEGSALDTDEMVAIYTEWYDSKGQPLPAELAGNGYTGRLAKIVGANTLGADTGSTSQFAIDPGKRLQLVKLHEEDISKQHFYVQVSAQPNSGNPDFSGTGAGSGPLQYRPKYYVPFKVPVYDETISLADKLYYNAEKDQLELTDPAAAEELIKPEPYYHWLYRPDYQFSVFDLDIQAINVAQADGNVIDLNGSESPTLSSSDQYLQLIYSLLGNENDVLEGFGPDRELIFAFGEEEAHAYLGEDKTITFLNPEHLADLEPEDFLSVRLYQNSDAENVLWEWAFEYLHLDTQLASYDSASGRPLYVSADNPVVPLKAALIGYADRDNDTKTPKRVRWVSTGGAALDVATEESSSLGIYFNEVTLPTVAGSQTQVSAHLMNSDTVAQLPPFVVVPGAAANISYASSGELHSAGVGEQTITFTVKDRHGNLLPNGTGISFTVEDSLHVVSSSESLVNGQATVVVKGGGYSGKAFVTAQVEDQKSTVQVDVKPLDVHIDFDGQLLVDGSETFKVIVTDSSGTSVSGVNVTLGSNFGYLQDEVLTTDSSGEVSSVIKAPNSKGQGELTAQVARLPQQKVPFTVDYQNGISRDLETSYVSVIGDKASDGLFQYLRYDNTTIDVPYQAKQTIKALGNSGDNVTIKLGDIHDPNRVILAAYFMNQVSGDVAIDETGHNSLQSRGVKVVNGTRIGMGQSFSFTASENSKLWLSDIALLDSQKDLGFTLEVLPKDDPRGVLFDLGQGAHKLSINSSSQLVYEVRTQDDSFTVISEPVFQGRWHQVAGRYHQGKVELSVNGKVVSVNATGDVDFRSGGDEFVVGENFTGQLNSFKWVDWSSQPVLTFENGSTEQSVIVGSEGFSNIAIHSAGSFNTNGSTLSIQRVAVHTGNSRQYVSLISLQAFGRIAEQYTDTLSKNAPAINLAALQPPYSSNLSGQFGNSLGLSTLNISLFPRAYAGTLSDYAMSVVNFMLPVESMEVIASQLSILADGGEVDGVAFMVAVLDVITYFPPARPLQILTKPLKGLASVMPRKFRKHFLEALDTIVDKAKSGDYDTLWNVLPFLVLAGQMFDDPEMRKGLSFLMSTVNSADDLLSWVDFLALPANDWVGEGIPEVDPFSDLEEQTSTNQLGWLFSSAYAANKPKKISASAIAAALNQAAKRITGEALRNLPASLAHAARKMKSLDSAVFRKYAFSPRFWAVTAGIMARRGQNALSQFLKGKTNARYTPVQVMSIVAYLEWELACGKALDQQSGASPATPEELATLSLTLESLECDGKGIRGGKNRYQVYEKYKYAFVDALSGKFDEVLDDDENYIFTGGGHGALFHMAQIARYQLQYRAGVGKPIKAIEGFRRIWLYKDEKSLNDAENEKSQDAAKKADQIVDAYSRYVDVVLGEEGEAEQWVELKSMRALSEAKPTYLEILKGQTIEPWNLNRNVSSAMSLHRQYSLDRAASHVGHARLAKDDKDLNPIIDVSPDFRWLFQKFDTKWTPVKGSKVQHDISVNLGKSNQQNTIRSDMAEHIAKSDVKKRLTTDVRLANMGDKKSNTDVHIEEADVAQLLEDLVSMGFEEAKDAVVDI